jgi:hypothetical protein
METILGLDLGKFKGVARIDESAIPKACHEIDSAPTGSSQSSPFAEAR